METPAALFMVWTDFGPAIGQANAGDATALFDDAVDAYADARDDGQPAIVWRLDTPSGKATGMMMDVTADADDCIRRRCSQLGRQIPDWLFDHRIAAE